MFSFPFTHRIFELKIKTKETVVVSIEEVKKLIQKFVEKKTGKKVVSVNVSEVEVELQLEEREAEVTEPQA